MTRINIGPGPHPLGGDFLNIDIEGDKLTEQFPGYHFIKADVRRGIEFPPDSVDLVVAHHFLEHLSYAEGREFLAECYRVLRPGGVLSLVCPDFDQFVAAYQVDRIHGIREHIDMVYPQDPVYPSMCHAALYTGPLLVDEAYKAGFRPRIMPLGEMENMVSFIWWQVAVLATKPV